MKKWILALAFLLILVGRVFACGRTPTPYYDPWPITMMLMMEVTNNVERGVQTPLPFGGVDRMDQYFVPQAPPGPGGIDLPPVDVPGSGADFGPSGPAGSFFSW